MEIIFASLIEILTTITNNSLILGFASLVISLLFIIAVVHIINKITT